MGARQRIYRVTEAGARAALAPPAGLSFPCRRILALLEGDTHFSVIRSGMGLCEEQQILDWLAQLEAAGLVHAQAAGAERDLDFTGSFSLAELASKRNAR